MTFTRTAKPRLALLGAIAISSALQAPALAQSINATQLSIVVAPNKIIGTALGGEISFMGTGLTAGAPGVLTNTGAYTAGTAGTANANTTFNFDLTVRAADVAPVAAVMGNDIVPITGTYGSQQGFYSNNAGNLGQIAISNVNAATLTTGDKEGSTATAVFSSSLGTNNTSSEIRRIATSSNDQATFNSTRQSARVQVGGSGLTAMSAVNVGTAALGATGSITVAADAQTTAGLASSKTEAVRTGQSGATLTASTSNITNPAYGVTTVTTGGISAGAITANNMNTLSVLSGNAGTTSTLSLIQSLTAF